MTDPLADIDAALVTAWRDLGDARAAWAHSPNADTLQLERIAEQRVNRLLERRLTLARAEAMVRN